MKGQLGPLNRWIVLDAAVQPTMPDKAWKSICQMRQAYIAVGAPPRGSCGVAWDGRTVNQVLSWEGRKRILELILALDQAPTVVEVTAPAGYIRGLASRAVAEGIAASVHQLFTVEAQANPSRCGRLRARGLRVLEEMERSNGRR